MKGFYDYDPPVTGEEDFATKELTEKPDIKKELTECEEYDGIGITCDAFNLTDLVDNYMFGISLVDQQGNPFPKSMLVSYLNAAISWAEQLFDICLTERIVEDEFYDYERNDYTSWGYMQLYQKPVKKVKSLQLMYGDRPSFTIPTDWIKLDKMGGKINLFPAQGSANALIINQSGVILGIQNRFGYAPQMWKVSYVAGMDEKDIPENLKVVIYKKATCDIMTVWGDLILGSGIANQSISIDGLSQSIGTTQSAMYGGASARVESYRKDIENEIPVIRQAFSSMRMVVL